MASYTGIPPNNPAKYLGAGVNLSSIVTRNRAPTSADIRQGSTGTYYPIGSFWVVSKNPTTGIEGDLWWLSKIASNVAYWLQVDSGITDLSTLTGDSGGAVSSTSGNINILGTSGQIVVTGTPGTSTLTLSLAGGSTAVDSFTPDTGTSPVLPTAGGLVSLRGQSTPNISGIQVSGATNALNISLFSPYVNSTPFVFGSGTGVSAGANTYPLQVASSNSGNNVSICITNNSNTASSIASLQVIVAGTTASSAITSYAISGGSTFVAGIKASDSTYRIAPVTLGTNDCMVISQGGLVRFPTAEGVGMDNGVIIGSALTIQAPTFLKIADVELGTAAVLDITTVATASVQITSSTGDAFIGLNANGASGYGITSRRSDNLFVIFSISDLLTISQSTGVVNILGPIKVGATGPNIISGTGVPGVSQPKGSLFLRTDGSGINTRAYIATDAVGTWTALVTVA